MDEAASYRGILIYRRTASPNSTAWYRKAASYRGILIYRRTASPNSTAWYRKAASYRGTLVYRRTASCLWAVVYRETGCRGMLKYRGMPWGWRHGICRRQWLATHDRLSVMYIARWLTSLKVINERTSVYSSDWIYACALASYSTPPIELNLLHAGVEATSRGQFENNMWTPIRYKHTTISIMNGEFRYIE